MNILDQKSALIYFIEDLDIEMIGSILDPDVKCLNESKQDFLRIFANCFDLFRRKGNSLLVRTPGRCKFSANNGESFIFSGDVSKDYIEINILTKEGRVIGIHECYCFSDDMADRSGHKVYIDSKRGCPF
ncbi:hypothetical protein [Dyadobacter sp. CY312]|uniref:hypothetical protein n=1 Tax=Dyadobacter sp. CY312 TaxID=2907303 RepID=UPI001F26F824|nr:hypothetical protein [Dyadobacter sp. CY312]MCE7043949.1 hypothetical protein [Dyadobacter sp. CY312]